MKIRNLITAGVLLAGILPAQVTPDRLLKSAQRAAKLADLFGHYQGHRHSSLRR